MCLLIETILIEERKLQNATFHNERFNRSRKELFGIPQESVLEDLIRLPSGLPSGKMKCRVEYSREIRSITFTPYLMKKLETLQLVDDDSIEYAYKFRDRQHLEKLAKNKSADDILIVKNGFITDTSYANIVFWDGIKWFTPSSPLLEGTMRSRLLLEKKIHQEKLRKSDIRFFKSAGIINAMIGLNESPVIKISNIF
jgi:4-amino-4-deoxychorismate lyase